LQGSRWEDNELQKYVHQEWSSLDTYSSGFLNLQSDYRCTFFCVVSIKIFPAKYLRFFWKACILVLWGRCFGKRIQLVVRAFVHSKKKVQTRRRLTRLLHLICMQTAIYRGLTSYGFAQRSGWHCHRYVYVDLSSIAQFLQSIATLVQEFSSPWIGLLSWKVYA